MQHTRLLHTILKKACAVKHKTRLNALLTAVTSVTLGANLSLTSMGRYMDKDIKPRSKIQGMNYLLGNGQLYNERQGIYEAMARHLCSSRQTIYIAVDWSSLVSHAFHLLRASVICKGRAMTLYEEIHPEKVLGNTTIQASFLQQLKNMLCTDVNIVIISDAGFRTDFFKQVQQLGWDYVGRLLSTLHYTPDGENAWEACTNLYAAASTLPKDIGAVILGKKRKLQSHLYLYQAIKPTHAMHKKRASKANDYSVTAQKPWLIASSLAILPKEIMKIYRERMKIEHDFRDLKDTQWGIGLRASRSHDPERLSIQLLIGLLAIFSLWLIGLCMEKQKLHYDFQANSIKHKRVLSLVFLGLEAVRSNYLRHIKPLNFDELIALENNVHE